MVGSPQGQCIHCNPLSHRSLNHWYVACLVHHYPQFMASSGAVKSHRRSVATFVDCATSEIVKAWPLPQRALTKSYVVWPHRARNVTSKWSTSVTTPPPFPIRPLLRRVA